MPDICEHVEYAERAEGVRVVRGTAAPVYGWSRELEADVPLLRCSECRATVRLASGDRIPATVA